MSEQKNGLEGFASQALRLHKQGAFENLLAQHLIMSVAIDPLIKVRLVCEASWMVDPHKIKLNLNQIETIYLVALSFLNTGPKEAFLSIAWGFILNNDNYERFIEPWRRKTPLFYCASCTAEREEKRKLLSKAECIAKEFHLFTVEFDLHPSSLQVLKTEFLRWCIPLVMKVFEKLSRLVQPDLYKEMLQVMKGEINKK